MNFELRGLLEKDFGVAVASVDLPKMTLRDIVSLTSYSGCSREGEKDSAVTTGAKLSIAGAHEVSGQGSTVSIKSDQEFTSQTSDLQLGAVLLLSVMGQSNKLEMVTND
jgi:hypothetical protein